MIERGEHTLSEIMSQPAIWRDALSVFQSGAQPLIRHWQSEPFDQVILAGCGSTYYLAQIGAALLQEQTGIPARAFTASELMLFPQVNFLQQAKTLFIAVSRSGKTRETIQAARLFRKHGRGSIAVITCTGDSELVSDADFVLAINSAQEKSAVQTRSFSSMAIQLQALAAALSGQSTGLLHMLPEIGSRLLAEYAPLIRELGQAAHIRQFAFLGSGVLYGLACEAMLKMLETSLVPSLAFHTLEFLHGPKYGVNDQMPTLVVGVLSDAAFDEEVNVLRQIQQRGGQILAVVENDGGSDVGEWSYVVRLHSGLPMWARAILYLPVLQLLAYYQGMARGKNPDRPL